MQLLDLVLTPMDRLTEGQTLALVLILYGVFAGLMLWCILSRDDVRGRRR